MYQLTDGSRWHASCLQMVPMLIRTLEGDNESVSQIPASVTPQRKAEQHGNDSSESAPPVALKTWPFSP